MKTFVGILLAITMGAGALKSQAQTLDCTRWKATLQVPGLGAASYAQVCPAGYTAINGTWASYPQGSGQKPVVIVNSVQLDSDRWYFELYNHDPSSRQANVWTTCCRSATAIPLSCTWNTWANGTTLAVFGSTSSPPSSYSCPAGMTAVSPQFWGHRDLRVWKLRPGSPSDVWLFEFRNASSAQIAYSVGTVCCNTSALNCSVILARGGYTALNQVVDFSLSCPSGTAPIAVGFDLGFPKPIHVSQSVPSSCFSDWRTEPDVTTRQAPWPPSSYYDSSPERSALFCSVSSTPPSFP